MRDYDEWAASLRLVGDEALLPSEEAARERRNAKNRERRATDPEYRAKVKATVRAWRARRGVDFRAEQREWSHRHRAKVRAELIAAGQVIVTYASLHSLACTGPTRATGCRCRSKVTLWRRAG